MKLKQSICGFSLAAALLSLGNQPAFADAKPPANPAAVAHSVSSADDRKAVSITVYNQNFGLVREVRELPSLGSGKVELEFRDVAANIQPQTVSIKAVGAGAGFSVLE